MKRSVVAFGAAGLAVLSVAYLAAVALFGGPPRSTAANRAARESARQKEKIKF